MMQSDSANYRFYKKYIVDHFNDFPMSQSTGDLLSRLNWRMKIKDESMTINHEKLLRILKRMEYEGALVSRKGINRREYLWDVEGE